MTVPRFDPKRRRAVTIALLLVTALASFEATVVSTAMPTIIGDLGGLALYSWVFAIYLMTATVMMPIYGRLADIYGRRRILLTAVSVFLAGAIACGFAHSMPQLIAARALQGLGAAGLVPIALTVSADLYSLEERAKVQGLFSGVWGVASLIGPLLGAWMTISFGWRSIFTINIPLGLIALILVATQMQESRAALPDPLDFAGAATLVAGIAGLLFAVLHRPAEAAMPLLWRAAIFAAAARIARPLRASPESADASSGAAGALPPDGDGGARSSRACSSARPSSASTRSCLSSCRARAAERRAPPARSSRRSFSSGPSPPRWRRSSSSVSAFGEPPAGARCSRSRVSSPSWPPPGGMPPSPGSRPRARSSAPASDRRRCRRCWRCRRRCPSVSAASRRRSFRSSARSGAPSESGRSEASSRWASFSGWGLRRRARDGSWRRGMATSVTATSVDPAAFRLAIERSLLPVFGILIGLAVVNVLVTGRFPERAVAEVDSPAEKVMLSVD